MDALRDIMQVINKKRSLTHAFVAAKIELFSYNNIFPLIFFAHKPFEEGMVLWSVWILQQNVASLAVNNGNRTVWSPIWSVLIRMIYKIGRPRSGSPICLIASVISICFLPQYSTPKKVFISRAWTKSWHKERASVVYNFLAIWLVYFPKSASLIGYYIAWQIDARHDAYSVVQTLIDNGKLANQISRLQAIL